MVRFQLTIDCADPGLLAAFWAEALGYVPEPAPEGFENWTDYWRSRGVEDEGLEDVIDRLMDPHGHGPMIWFQQVPEAKVLKNRLHLDLNVGGGRGAPLEQRTRLVRARAAHLVALGATVLREMSDEQGGFFGMTLADPEGNEFCLH